VDGLQPVESANRSFALEGRKMTVPVIFQFYVHAQQADGAQEDFRGEALL